MRRSLLAPALAATALLVSPLRADAAEPKKSEMAPEFGFEEQIQGLKFTNLKALRGKVVVIDFFGNW